MDPLCLEILPHAAGHVFARARLALGGAFLLLLGAGYSVCAQSATGPDSVGRYLQTGGPVYGYLDVDGDAEALVDALSQPDDFYDQSRPRPEFLDPKFGPIVQGLGLGDVSAVGLSSVKLRDGCFENRVFIHTPRGRHGLLQMFEGPPKLFQTLWLAPVDTDFYYESDLNVAPALRAIESIVGQLFGGRQGAFIRACVEDDLRSFRDNLLMMLSAGRVRVTALAVLDPAATALVDGDPPIKIPALSALVRIEGIGKLVVPLLDQIPTMELSIRDGRRHYAIIGPAPVSTWTPAIIVDGDVVYAGSSQAFVVACLKRTQGLGEAPAFRSALAELGETGNALTWISSRARAQGRRLIEFNPKSRSSFITDIGRFLPNSSQEQEPLLAIRSDLPDGILYHSRWSHSLKHDLVVSGVFNPVTVGMSVAILKPYYERARSRAEEWAIYTNLRRLQVHARQYCYDRQLRTVPVNKIMGNEPGKRVPLLEPVAGENYLPLVFVEDMPLSVITADGRVIQYGP